MLLCLLTFCRAEEERRRDLAERDALSERLKKKDKERTRNIVEKSNKKVRVGVHVHVGRWINRLPFLIDNQLCHVPIHKWPVGQVYSMNALYFADLPNYYFVCIGI